MPEPRSVTAADVARHLPLRPVACAVLASLSHGARPGIDVLEAVNATLPGRPILGPGTLYRLLRELRQARLIVRAEPEARATAAHDDRQVHHLLTPLGEAVLRAELARLRRTLTLADRVRPAPQR
jgi:DNA-binding PadR family transcriptional regulator